MYVSAFKHTLKYEKMSEGKNLERDIFLFWIVLCNELRGGLYHPFPCSSWTKG